MNDPKRTRLATTLFFLISGFGFTSWASRIPDVQRNLHLSEAELGGILFALPLGLLLTLPVTGALLQRYSSRVIMFGGALAFNVMLCLIGLASAPWQLVIILFAFGSSRNLLNISMNAQAVGVQGLYDRSIINAFHGSWSLAGCAGSGIGFILIYFHVGIGWHLAFVGAALVLLGFYAFPDTLRQPPAPRSSKGFILPDKTLFKYGLITFASMSCEGTMYDWSSIYFLKAVGVPQQFGNTGFLIYMTMMAIGRFTGDKLVPKLGAANMIRYSGLMLFCGLFTAAAFPYPIPAALGFMTAGLGVSCVSPLVFALGGRASVMDNASAIAAISTVGYTGFLIVPPLVGFLAEATGLRWTFAIMSGFGLAITFLVLQIKQPPAKTTTVQA